MDEGYMAFATDDEYLGVAFRNLKGKTLYPIVAAVWGHCEISMRYLGSLERELITLSPTTPSPRPPPRRPSPPRPLFYSPLYKPPVSSSAAIMAAAQSSPVLPFSPFSDLAKIFSFYDLQAGGTSSSSSSYSLFEPPAEWHRFDEEPSPLRRSESVEPALETPSAPTAPPSAPSLYLPAPPSSRAPSELFGPPLTPGEQVPRGNGFDSLL